MSLLGNQNVTVKYSDLIIQETLKKSSLLSDIPDKPAARANLGSHDATNLITGYLPDARLREGSRLDATPVTDWNSATNTGVYTGLNATNAPAPTVRYIGEVFRLSATYISQTLVRLSDGVTGDNIDTWRRQCLNGAWTAWTQLVTVSVALKAKLDTSTSAETINSMVERDSNGDILARTFKTSFSTTYATPAYIMTQVNQTTDSQLRPTTLAQLAAAMTISQISGTVPDSKLTGTYTGFSINTAGTIISGSHTVNGNFNATGQINAGGNVQSNGANLILGAAGGAVYLRPYGVGNGTGQAYVDTNGSFVASGNVYAYSDIRVKKNIVKLEDTLTKINQLNGYSFTMIANDENSLGVIAQEVYEVYPELVEISEDGTLSVAYANMAGIFIEAIKELHSEIKQLKTVVEELKNGNAK
jgi:hypothetical protein